MSNFTTPVGWAPIGLPRLQTLFNKTENMQNPRGKFSSASCSFQQVHGPEKIQFERKWFKKAK